MSLGDVKLEVWGKQIVSADEKGLEGTQHSLKLQGRVEKESNLKANIQIKITDLPLTSCILKSQITFPIYSHFVNFDKIESLCQ